MNDATMTRPSGLKIDELVIWGRPVRYAEYGPIDAKDTVFIFNGIGANVQSAERFMTAFKSVRVICFDVPGVGGTPTPVLPYRLGFVVDLAARILDKLGVKTAHVFGASWGGAAAQQFAFTHRNRCASLTLAATTAGMVMVPGEPKSLMKMLTPKRHADPTFMLENAETLYGGTIALEQELLREFAEALDHGTPVGYIYQLMAISGWTSWHFLPSLKMPALVLMGEDDRIIPVANGRLLAGRLGNATMEVIPCGHLFIVTKPTETAARIEAFVKEHSLVAA